MKISTNDSMVVFTVFGHVDFSKDVVYEKKLMYQVVLDEQDICINNGQHFLDKYLSHICSRHAT